MKFSTCFGARSGKNFISISPNRVLMMAFGPGGGGGGSITFVSTFSEHPASTLTAISAHTRAALPFARAVAPVADGPSIVYSTATVIFTRSLGRAFRGFLGRVRTL